MTHSIIEFLASTLADEMFLFNGLAASRGESMLSIERPNVSYARKDGPGLRIAEALRLAHQVEALLEEAAKDPSADAHALRMAQGLARSLIVELGERPLSDPMLASAGRGGGPAKVA